MSHGNRLVLALALIASSTNGVWAQHHDHGTSAPVSHDSGRALGRQLDAVRSATARFRDVEVARAEGFVRFGKEEGPLMGEHWYRKGGADAPAADSIDLERPGTLMYAVVGGERVLVGVAYSVRLRPGAAMPAGFAGASDRWHVHDVEKMLQAITEDRPLRRWIGERWLDRRRRDGDDRTWLAMVHAWVHLPNPDGPFADQHRAIPYLKLGLPVEWARRGDVAAARGLQLATDGGCRSTVGGQLWAASATREQRRTIEGECDRLARRMRDGLDRHRADPTALHAEAHDVWLVLDAAMRRTLTDRQRSRLASITEHPMAP